MLNTPSELVQALADRIRIRRLAMDFSQQEAAQRSGIAYRTWRRLETEGRASIEDLVKAEIALRCDEALEALFSAPAARTLVELVERLARKPGGAMPKRSRATRRANKSP